MQQNPNQHKKLTPQLGYLLLLLPLIGFIFPTGQDFFKYTFLHSSKIHLSVNIGIDKLSQVMGVFIIIISTLIYKYATNYLKSEVRRPIFLFQFILVVYSALLLSVAQNLVTAFIAWQLMGINLYLLLNYYHHDANANKSAKKKFVINRIGDCTFLLAIIVALHSQSSTAFSALQHTNSSREIGLLLFISVLTKCAQFPFHIWLLDTMEAPTPVSALMHAGIINSGGILLTRVSHLIISDHFLLGLILTLSLVTIILTGHWKRRQPDIKKQLAYSTSGQMGYMLMQCSVGAFPAAIFHLITHGFFKASLFLNAGSTLNINDKESNKVSYKNLSASLFVTALITSIYLILSSYIGLKLPIIISTFIILTIYTVTNQVNNLKEITITTKITLYFIITFFICIYMFLLDHLTIFLSQYQYSKTTISVFHQSIAIIGLIIASLLIYKSKIGTLISPDRTERLLRVYVLNPVRSAGEIFSSVFDKKIIVYSLSLLIITLFIFSLMINQYWLSDANIITDTIVISLLIINIVILLAANKAHSFLKLIFLLFLYQVVFTAYALIHMSPALNKIIIYNAINLAPVFILLFNIAKYHKRYPKHYLTTALLLLIGIPGSASFIAETSLLNAMYEMGGLYLFLYLSGIMMLSLTIMHALQLYSYGKEDNYFSIQTSLLTKVYFISTILLNIFFGLFPQTLLSIL